MLNENDIIDAICMYLEQQDFVIMQRLHTSKRGIDIIAAHSTSGKRFHVEAKGGTSSHLGSSRYGKPYTKSQVFDRTAKGIYTLLQMHGKSETTDLGFALAVPNTALFREYLKPIKDTIAKLGLKIFLVDEAKHVREM